MNLKSVFSIYSIRQISFWLCINCSKIQEFENRRDLYTPALGLFNYHIKVKRKCLYQFLIKLTPSISIRQITDILKQRPRRCSVKIGVLKNFTDFTGKQKCQSLQVYYKRDSNILWILRNFLRTPFFPEHLRTTVSGH